MRTGFHADRLGLGEWLDGIGSVALAAVLFIGGGSRPAVLLGLALLVGVLGVIEWWTCARRRSPAVPLVIVLLQTPFAWIATVWLAVRALVGAGGLTVRWSALAAAVAVIIGIYLTFRREGVPAADSPAQIETLRLPR